MLILASATFLCVSHWAQPVKFTQRMDNTGKKVFRSQLLSVQIEGGVSYLQEHSCAENVHIKSKPYGISAFVGVALAYTGLCDSILW